MQTAYNDRPAAARAGMIKDSIHDSYIVSRVAGVLLSAGRFVTRLTGDADDKVSPPAAAADITGGTAQGFVVFQEMKMPVTGGEYAAVEQVPVMRKGRIVVITETTVTEGGAVHVRYAGTGNAGECRSAAVASETAILPGARYAETTTAAGLAVVEINLP